MRKISKRLLLKLGTACNLSCPHCHQVQKNFKEHPHLIDWIKHQRFDRITFSGGEPLMYFDTIKRIMTKVGRDPLYRMMTNGTLLTDEMVDFFNGYKMQFAVSYDGQCGGRDLAVPIRWNTVKKMNGYGLCTIFSRPDFSFHAFRDDMDNLCREQNLPLWTDTEFLKINWIHQTKDAPNKEFTREVADSYIAQVTQQLEKALYCFSRGALGDRVIKNLIGRWYAKKLTSYGVACCNEAVFNVNLDGTVMLCPYGTTVIGTINDLPEVEQLDSFIPEKCRTCECWDICHCSCVASVSELDCYVNKIMIQKVKTLIAQFHLEKEIGALFNN